MNLYKERKDYCNTFESHANKVFSEQLFINVIAKKQISELSRYICYEISPMQYTAGNPVQSSFLNMAPKVKKEGLWIYQFWMNKSYILVDLVPLFIPYVYGIKEYSEIVLFELKLLLSEL